MYGSGAKGHAPGPGDEFLFRYQQAIRLPFYTDVTTSLVLREIVPGPLEDGKPTRFERDHLIAMYTEREWDLPAGGFLQMQCPVRLPADLGDFPVSH